MKNLLAFTIIILFFFSCDSDTKSSNTKEEKDTTEKNGLTINVNEGGEKASISIGSGGIKIEADDGNESAKINIGKDGVSIAAVSDEDGVGNFDAIKIEITEDDIFLTGAGLDEEIEADGQFVVVSGEGNTIKLEGSAKGVKIVGSSNTVYVEKVGNIKLNGINNKIFYKEGVEGRIPIVKKSGDGNKAEQKDW